MSNTVRVNIQKIVVKTQDYEAKSKACKNASFSHNFSRGFLFEAWLKHQHFQKFLHDCPRGELDEVFNKKFKLVPLLSLFIDVLEIFVVKPFRDPYSVMASKRDYNVHPKAVDTKQQR